jgi:hypothetical protein
MVAAYAAHRLRPQDAAEGYAADVEGKSRSVSKAIRGRMVGAAGIEPATPPV